MGENEKNLIKSSIYYGIAFGYQNSDEVMRGWNLRESKEWCDDLLNGFPENHLARAYYNKVEEKDFKQARNTAFAKMCMWQIKNQKGYSDNLTNEEAVDALANEINKIQLDDLKAFLQENDELTKKEPQKYNYYFILLYRYLTSLKENENVADYYIKQIELLENYEFTQLFRGSSDDEENQQDKITLADEKYNYLNYAYDYATWYLHDEKKYELAEKYFKKHISFLENYVEITNSYRGKKSLATAYANYGYMFWDKDGNISEKAEELTYKSIEIRKQLLDEYPEYRASLDYKLSVNYKNLAYAYKEEYKKDKSNEAYKSKYYDLYKQALVYAEDIIKIDESDNKEDKIKNYYKAGEICYYIYDDDKAKEYLQIALDTCNEDAENNSDWIEKINELLTNMSKDK